MPADAAGFIKRFEEHWAAPTPESFAALFAPGATSLHPPATEPTKYEDLADDIAPVFAAAPDLVLTVRNWAADGDFVLIEWEVNATMGGERLHFGGADRFTLDGDLATEGIAFFDPSQLVAGLERAGAGAEQTPA